uniref:PHR domain-containing protein n=1 Tax=Panthera tigris altaica TaxID=74533 RepID=A0A8C9KPH5_PANTA
MQVPLGESWWPWCPRTGVSPGRKPVAARPRVLGPDSHYGTKGLRKVTHESPTTGAKTCFTFCYAAGNNNGTSVEDGQIPEVIFYT